jgi:hypothetical protein
MSLKREMLVEAGIEDKAVIDSLMNAYGSGLRMRKHKLSLNYKLKTTALNNNLSNKAKHSTNCKPKRERVRNSNNN